jgi:hypothetical protein
MEGVPIPFVETAAAAAAVASSQSLGFIECFADSLATCLGQEYTIGVPCDYAVALCSHEKRGGGESDDDGEELIPLELDDPELDDVFPVAEAIVADGTSSGALSCFFSLRGLGIVYCSVLTPVHSHGSFSCFFRC